MYIYDTWETLSIGSDESGKGDFFGGPAVAAVKLDQKTLDLLKKQPYYDQIKDSKTCADKLIKEMAPQIMKICTYSCISLTPKQYNERYQGCKNINTLFAVLHNQVHKEVEGTETRVIDAFVHEDLYYQHLESQNEELTKLDVFTTKAETQYLSVALASIIVRYEFIVQMERLSQNHKGIKIPYGNSYIFPNSVVTAYRELIKAGYSAEYIDENLVKSHFTTLKKIKKELTVRGDIF